MNGARFELNKTPRRLCVHSSIIEFLRSETKPSTEHVRSFLSSCPNEIEIPTEHLAVIPKSFPLLRVLDIESLKLKSLPKQLYHLYHLRYLAVSTDLRCLPQGFNKFENMQTLVFNTSQDSLEVEADIWSLTKLRHVCTNNCMQLPLPSSNTGSTGIQTLSFISPSSCTAEILGKTPNLQKLGIRGNIVELMHMESKEGRNSPSFENLGKLIRLDNLKLLNNGGRPGELLNNVPQHIMFPQSLRKLTLSNMWLKWKNMRILGALDELEVLKLKEHSFMGESWELSDKDTIFKQLQFLMIGRTDLVEWKTSPSCFPKLEKLVLKDCPHLSEIPPEFTELPYFKQMELYGINEGAVDLAKKIHEEQYKQGTEQFKLLIDPPPN
nr:putative late blight resistance protein homolog R1B-14 [Ipomoea batatas]